MSLNFAAITPHPPIIVPEVGGDEIQNAVPTIQAMKKLGFLFGRAEIETLIVISPHMLIYPDSFSISGMKKLFGTFASFNVPDLIIESTNDMELAFQINKKGQNENIPTLLYDNGGEFFELDHGIMVPLYYLTYRQENPTKILPIAYSNLPRAAHFSFGQIIAEVVKKYPGRVGVVASGDLSHRLKHGAPGGFAQSALEFDKKIVEDIKNKKTKEILYYDEDFVEAAGECGYRSILILLGILDGLNISPEILSYEGPFGVGYLVVNYKLPEA